jgi:hypothetical protein
MKRKILMWIKQKLCRHEFEFVECDYIDVGMIHKPYFLYRCRKCNKSNIIYISSIISQLDEISPFKALDYPKDILWLPDSYINETFRNSTIKRESREVGYLVSKYYSKNGILLTAWGNRKFGPKVDRNNLEMKSHDEIKREDGLPLFILSPNELRENSEKYKKED